MPGIDRERIATNFKNVAYNMSEGNIELDDDALEQLTDVAVQVFEERTVGEVLILANLLKTYADRQIEYRDAEIERHREQDNGRVEGHSPDE